MESYTLYNGDCLDILPTLPDQSVDAIIADPPYGTTACKWDSLIPFEPMWKELKRIIKPRGAIVLFGSQPFTSALIMSNVKWFKYSWVWKKTRSFDMFNGKNKPLNIHEDICVFSDGTVANKSDRRMTYNPQGLRRVNQRWKRSRQYNSAHKYDRPSNKLDRVIEFTDYPQTVIEFSNPNHDTRHPTQKPLLLMEYLICTYTNEGDTVLDFTMGSGTTGVACLNTGRRFVGIEKEREYFDIAQSRIEQTARAEHQIEMAV
jgi:site-specific DNA-methyltransferase (adenine-specific)